MAKFVPKEKLSKKARKELDAQRRTLWKHSPVTTKIESKKLYSRKKKSHDRYDDTGMGFCLNYQHDPVDVIWGNTFCKF